jgi:hypothetical protein
MVSRELPFLSLSPLPSSLLSADDFAIVVRNVLDLPSLARLARTCHLAHTILAAEDIWETIFHRLHGHSDVDAISSDRTWKERVRLMLVYQATLASDPPDHVVFEYGIWLLCADKATGSMYIQSAGTTDEPPITVEVVWQSNGWWRVREGGEEWVVWSQANRSPQRMYDSTVQSLFHRTPPAKRVPLLVGTHIGSKRSDGTVSWCTIEVRPDVLYVHFHRAISTAQFMTISRTSARDVIFCNINVADIPLQP